MKKTLIFIFFIIAALVTLVIQGAIPFFTTPTFNQILFTAGFAKSIANNANLLNPYAYNIGYPHHAAIAFGLSLAYPTSIFIRLGITPFDAYTLAYAGWIIIAFLGAYKFSKFFNVNSFIGIILSLLWINSSFIWYHQQYGALALGFALLPAYILTSIKLFTHNDLGINIKDILVNLIFVIIAVFMDGYSFVMFAVVSSIFAVYYFNKSNYKKEFLYKVIPFHLINFVVAYILYALFIGKLDYSASSLDFFRAYSLDLSFIVLPTKGVYYLWDLLHYSITRSAAENFGDASVWTATFALPIILAGSAAFFITERKNKIRIAFLIIMLSGLYMSLGPSLKINSKKTANMPTMMSAKSAMIPTGSAIISQNIPGFKNMRTPYRWEIVALLGAWCLLLLIASANKKKTKLLTSIIVSFLFLSNLPNIQSKLKQYISNRKQFLLMDKTIISNLKSDLKENEIVAFLPWANDFLVDYWAAAAKIKTFNIGGDKNLRTAIQYWPSSIKALGSFSIKPDFTRLTPEKLNKLFFMTNTSTIIIPRMGMFEESFGWPPRMIYNNQVNKLKNKLLKYNLFSITSTEYYIKIKQKQL